MLLILIIFYILHVNEIFSEDKKELQNKDSEEKILKKEVLKDFKVRDLPPSKKSNQDFPDFLFRNPSLEKIDYNENDFRRGGILFFLSTPAFFIYNLIIIQMINFANVVDYQDLKEILNFSYMQWGYLITSSILGGAMLSLDSYLISIDAKAYYFQYDKNREETFKNSILEKNENKENLTYIFRWSFNI